MKPHVTAFPSAKQDRAAVLLASGTSVKHTATEVKAGVRTVYDWLGDVRFIGLVDRYRGRLIGESLGLLAGTAVDAVRTLRDALGSDKDTVRVRAALGILDQLIRVREATELAERVAGLEQALKTRNRGARS
jgi:hypothetical protein